MSDRPELTTALDGNTFRNYYYLKEEYKLRGIHIDDETTPAPKGYKDYISRYCTHLDQLKEAKKNADCVLLKYIFDSQTEPDQKATFTIDELKEASRKGLIDRHVYALGGMNLDTIKAVKDLGFGGIVISGDLWNRFNIHQELEYQALIDHFCTIRKAIG